MRPLLRAALPVLAAVALAGADVSAQEGCQFIEGSGDLRSSDSGSGTITRVTTPNLACRDGVRIRADSATAYQASNYVQLMGRVRFEDPERVMNAANAEYFSAVGRLQAHGAVEVLQKRDGAVIRGEELVYNRAGAGRARDQVDVYGGRPTARLFVRPSAVPAPDSLAPVADTASVPYDVEADRILLEGESYFRALGTVEVVRDGLEAFGDTVEYDQVAGTLRLARDARMLQEGRDLAARTIHILLPGEEVREVTARGRAVLTSEDVTLRAPLVRVYFAAGAMERLVAVPIAPAAAPLGAPLPAAPPPDEADVVRPVATARDFRVVGDSLDVTAPGEVLDRIHATGSARAESTGSDSLDLTDVPALARTDWIEGDTVVATFVRVAAAATPAAPAAPAPGDSLPTPPSAGGADTTAVEYRLDRLSAVGSARSLYRMPPGDSARARGDLRPAIHYVTGSAIVIELVEGEIDRMEVTGRTDGIHLEPVRPGAAAPDSVATDSVATGVAPGGAPPTVGSVGAPGPDRAVRRVAGAERRARRARRGGAPS